MIKGTFWQGDKLVQRPIPVYGSWGGWALVAVVAGALVSVVVVVML